MALVIAMALYSSHCSLRSRFDDIFKKSMAFGIRDNDELLNRWASKFIVCFYGGKIERTKKDILLFFDMIKMSTWLDPKILFEKEIINCPNETFIYVRLHQDNLKLKLTLFNDMMFVLKRGNLTENHEMSFNKYGLFAIFVEEGKEPRLYGAINELTDASDEVSLNLAKNLIQQELLQALLIARDIEVTRDPVSIIEERRVPNVPAGEDDPDPKYRQERFKLNVPNMCLVDIMLLTTLYARDESIFDDRYGSYMRYIENNFSKIKSEALKIQNDPRYRDLFVGRC